MEKKAPIVTIGTAGKVFIHAPGDWKPFPRITVEDWDAPPRRVRGEDRGTTENSTPYAPLADIAFLIDHTLLKPEASESDVSALCREARDHRFHAVCVNPRYVNLAWRDLKGSGVKVCTVAGFPLGASASEAKAAEARIAVADGADEVDMVLAVGALKSGNVSEVAEDIAAVRKACEGKILKVILETCLLTREEKVRACLLAKASGADFVKTSTGFASGGATVEDVALLRAAVGPEMGVKASGGVRDAAFALALIRAGATRLGTSASVAIVKGIVPGSGKKEGRLPY